MRTAAAVIPIVITVLIAGCTGGENAGEATNVEGVAVDARDGSVGGPDAGLEGNLVVEDGCFYLADRGMKWVLSFPKGDVDRDGAGIRFDGTTYVPGDKMTLRGQEDTPDDLEAPSTCKTDLVWMVFSKDA
jgi:hypothetical protein